MLVGLVKDVGDAAKQRRTHQKMRWGIGRQWWKSAADGGKGGGLATEVHEDRHVRFATIAPSIVRDEADVHLLLGWTHLTVELVLAP